ncbi:Alpha/Beta hydrolase protein [Scenedesmus sp. NREL 46B-D3]|nr:Alpha/Beta hydrolase protein [Scenedesmus sp. NREL 46B-D3]
MPWPQQQPQQLWRAPLASASLQHTYSQAGLCALHFVGDAAGARELACCWRLRLLCACGIEQVLVGLNRRDPRCFDMYRLNLSSGQLVLDTENPGNVVAWYADAAFQVRAALVVDPGDGSKTLCVRRGHAGAAWHDVVTWPQEEEGRVVCFAKDGRSIYVTSSLGRDTTELQLLALHPAAAPAAAGAADTSPPTPAGGAVAAIHSATTAAAAGVEPSSSSSGPVVLSRLASLDRCDVGQVLVDKLQWQPLAVGFDYLRQEWQVLESSLQADFQTLLSFKGPDADLAVEARSNDGSVWLVAYSRDDAPTEYYVYDRSAAEDGADAAGTLQFLFVNRPELSKYTLGRKHPVLLQARDGITLPSYLTLPPLRGAPKSLLPPNPEPLDPGSEGWGSVSGLNLPMVLFVHGGPWGRDVWGLDSTAQWFANRGYAVLQVNFRASSGFGKRFLHLGDGQWGVGTMQHDLSDAVAWAVAAGIADRSRVAIYGVSYGGYACLAGLAYTPGLYCCGVDIVGPSHVRTLLGTIPAYWAPAKRLLIDRIGDAETDDDLNRRISPLYHAPAMRAPLVIAQGANDPRVKRAESDQIYNALRDKGLEVQYFLYEDEGHGFARPPNRLDFCSRVDHFLAKHLGGRAEAPLEMQDTSVVALHEYESLDDYKPPAAASAAGHKPAGAAAAVATAAAVAGAAAAGAKHEGGVTGGMGLGRKVGLAVGVPAAVLAGAAALAVAVLRGLSPRR